LIKSLPENKRDSPANTVEGDHFRGASRAIMVCFCLSVCPDTSEISDV